MTQYKILESVFQFSVYLDDYDIKQRMGVEGIAYKDMDTVIKAWVDKGWVRVVEYIDTDVRHIYFLTAASPRVCQRLVADEKGHLIP